MKGRAVVACLLCLALAPAVGAQVLPPPRPVRDDSEPAIPVIPALPGGTNIMPTPPIYIPPREDEACPYQIFGPKTTPAAAQTAPPPEIAIPEVALPTAGPTPAPNPGDAAPTYAPAPHDPRIPPAVASDLPLTPGYPPAVAGFGGAVDRPPPLPQHRLWFENDVLLWSIHGAQIPTLLTTSPSGTAGVLGQNGTNPLVGPGRVDSGLRIGDRFRTGFWFDDDQKLGVEVGALFMQNAGQNWNFNTGSAGGAVLARPFTDAASGANTSTLVSSPGAVNGHFAASYASTGLLGTGIWLRENFCSSNNPYCNVCQCCDRCGAGGCGSGGCGDGCGSQCYYRFDSLLGYRYLRLSDNLNLQDDTTNLINQANGLAGTTISATDHFHTINNFHGLDLGVTGDVTRGPWSVRFTGKVAFGVDNASVDILGSRTTTSPGGAVTMSPNGILAAGTNTGHFSRTQCTAVPELNLNFGYNINQQVRIFAGYSFLYWAHVVRAGDQVDTTLNSNLVNGGSATAAAQSPHFSLQETGTWAQGVNLGLEWRY